MPLTDTDDHAVKTGQLARAMYEKPNGDTGDAEDGAPALPRQRGSAIVDRADKITVTRIRNAKLSNSEIDNGTLPTPIRPFEIDWKHTREQPRKAASID